MGVQVCLWTLSIRLNILFEKIIFNLQIYKLDSGKEEDTKMRIRNIQDEMREFCDTNIDKINWSSLASHQDQIVELVSTLSCAPLLLPRECQSLANLSQLARNPELQQKALDLWKDVLHNRKVAQAIKQFQNVEKSFREWRHNMNKGLPPHEKEIESFLWLMWLSKTSVLSTLLILICRVK